MRRPRGFTIIEILMTITILLVGIVGVISLFPMAIKIGSEAISDSLAANLARSVEEPIRAAMRNRSVSYTIGGDRQFLLMYFIYEHDGVYAPVAGDERSRRVVRKDAVPPDPSDVLRGRRGVETPYGSAWALDNVVLLPCDTSPSASQGVGYGGATSADARRQAYLSGKVFVYPEGDPDEGGGASANGRGNPRNADDDKDDFERHFPDRRVVDEWRSRLLPGEEWPLRVTRTYRFGTRLKPGEPERGSGGERLYEIADDREDPYRMYSYAFAIRRAYEDGNLSREGRRYAPANELFEVKVMVFRGFMRDMPSALSPVYTSTFLVSR